MGLALPPTWKHALFCIAFIGSSSAYFGLTGKSQIHNVKDIDQEAAFMAGDEKGGVYFWNEDGYYTAPSNGYEKIDLSPQPDAEVPTRGQRSKKNADQRKLDHNIEGKGDSGKHYQRNTGNPLVVPENQDAQLNVQENNQRATSPGKQETTSPDGRVSHDRPSPSYARRHAGPYPGYHARFPRMPKYPRRPYSVEQYRFQPGNYRYGADNVKLIPPGYGPRYPAGRGQGTYGRQPPRQAVSRPIQSINIRRLHINKNGVGSYPRRARWQYGAPRPKYQNADADAKKPGKTGSSQTRLIDQTWRDDKSHPPRRANSEENVGSAPLDPTSLSGQSKRTSMELGSNELDHSDKQTGSSESDPSPAGSVGQTEIKPLFVSEDIPSIMTFMGVDDEGRAYVSVDEEIDPSSLSSSLLSDAGSRAVDLPSMVPSSDVNRKEARRECDEIKLTRKQRKICKRDPGLPQVLNEATATSVAECQHQFRFERWNCSTGSTRIHLLSKGNRETAFLFAVSSAGLTHSVARACAEGHLERCSCDETYSDHVNQEAWMWGGCGDNVHTASKFVRQFLKPKSRSRDTRAEVDKHNSDMGIRVVRQSVQKTCKCHGVSGSCTTKTCWRRVAPFYEIGRKIKTAYDRSVKVGSFNSADGRLKLIRSTRTRRNRPEMRPNQASPGNDTAPTGSLYPVDFPRRDFPGHLINVSRQGKQRFRTEHRRRDNPRSNELVYLENSPQYCRRTRYSLGTKGRLCDKQKNCDKICCGRGHTTHVRIVRRSCECEVRWCCYVECKTCTERKEIHVCN